MDISKNDISKTKKKIYLNKNISEIKIFSKNDISKKRYIQKMIYPKINISKKENIQKRIDQHLPIISIDLT